MHLNHHETIPHTPNHGKSVFYEDVPSAKQVWNCHLTLHISMNCCQKWKFQAHYKQIVPAPQTPYL